MKIKEKGLKINLNKGDAPVIINCGGEEVRIRRSKSASLGQHVILIEAPKKVGITAPTTYFLMKEEIEKLKKEIANLKKGIKE